jgi:hypothetical protein
LDEATKIGQLSSRQRFDKNIVFSHSGYDKKKIMPLTIQT